MGTNAAEGHRRRERFVVALLALVFTGAFFIEYLPPWARVHLWSDIAGYHYPLQAYAFDSFKHHRIPLWDSSIYCGISFVGNVQAAFLYPPTWLMYLAARGLARLPFKIYEIFAFLHVWIAFLTTYLWLRGRVRVMAALLAAGVFALSGFVMWQLLHPGVLGAAAWLPLGLWGIDEAAERRDWRPLWKLVAASALAFLAGYTAAWIVDCVIAVVYAATGRERLRTTIGACAALGASMLLAAAQLLPALDARSLMQLEPKYGPGAYGLRTLLAGYFLPNWFDFNPPHPTNYEPGCLYLYLGLPGVFGVLWALRQSVWRRDWRPYVQPAVTLAAALFLANPPALFLRLVERVDAVENVMQPYNFYAGAGAMAALIAALALEYFLAARPGLRRETPRWAALAAVAAMAIWAGRHVNLWLARGGRFPSHLASVREMAIGLALFAAGLWAFRASRGRLRALVAAVVLLFVGIDFKVYGSGRWFNALAGDLDGEHVGPGMPGMNAEAFAALVANRSWRVACDEAASPYSTDLRFYDLATPQGFDPFLPAEYRARIERWTPFRTNRLFFTDVRNEEMLRGLGVRYVITHEGAGSQPFLAASPNFRRVGGLDSFYLVYEYLRAVPPYRWEDGRTGMVEVAAWKPERRDFVVESDRPGRFVLLEQFFPGWRATVDGRPAAIARWDGTFQSIELPAGAHRVRFLFRPVSVETGAGISLAALAGLAAWIAADRRARRPVPRALASAAL
jgi:hypothetical protein